MRSISLTLPLLLALGCGRKASVPPGAADSAETDGQRVVRYRAGITPAVQYVEGCA